MTAIVIFLSLRVHHEENKMSILVYGIIRLIGTKSNVHERNNSFYHIFLLGLHFLANSNYSGNEGGSEGEYNDNSKSR